MIRHWDAGYYLKGDGRHDQYKDPAYTLLAGGLLNVVSTKARECGS